MNENPKQLAIVKEQNGIKAEESFEAFMDFGEKIEEGPGESGFWGILDRGVGVEGEVVLTLLFPEDY